MFTGCYRIVECIGDCRFEVGSWKSEICSNLHLFICAIARIDQSDVGASEGIHLAGHGGKVWWAPRLASLPFRRSIDFRARQNSYGHDLRVTSLAAADALSAAAGLVIGKISRTLAIIRGLA